MFTGRDPPLKLLPYLTLPDYILFDEPWRAKKVPHLHSPSDEDKQTLLLRRSMVILVSNTKVYHNCCFGHLWCWTAQRLCLATVIGSTPADRQRDIVYQQ